MRIFKLFSVVLLLWAMVVPVAAQKRNINLTITVTGPSGAPVPTASVLLKQTDFALSYGTITLNEQGTAKLKV